MRKSMVIGVVLLAVFIFSVPLMAAEWNFYGSARMATFYYDDDKDAGDDERTVFDLQGNARIGSKVKFDEKIGGVFEFAVTDESAVSTRLMYATYNFGPGVLTIGQNYTPMGSLFYSNQVQGWMGDDTDLLGTGVIYAHRRPLIMVSMKGLDIALVEVQGGTDLGSGGDEDVLLPRLEAKYHYAAENFFADVFGGVQSYEIEDIPELGGDETVTSYAIGVGGGAVMGNAYVRATVYMARNEAQMATFNVTDASAFYDSATGELVDNDTIGAALIAGFKASEKLTLEAGVGYVESELDRSDFDKDDAMSYYAQAVVNIYKGFFLVPEVGVVDRGDDKNGVSQGKTTYFGAKWQINF